MPAEAGYSGTPLVKKLGIRPQSSLALIGAPPGFERLLTGLPPSVVVRTRAVRAADIVIWFVTRRAVLEARIPAIAAHISPGDGMWIAWPKKASGVTTDVGEAFVRAAGLAHGLVDYKICAIDATWSGLKFARRKTE